jgi:hypothetical protein
MQLIQEANVMVHIPKHLMKRYKYYLESECDFHNVFIYPHTNKKKSTAMLPFCITEEEIQLGVTEWNEDYQPDFEYEQA